MTAQTSNVPLKHIGRPLKYKTAKQIEEIGQKYIDKCKENGEPILITGLALALDTDRKTLINYQNNEMFFNTINKLKQQCECYAEEKLFVGNNTTGAIFALKNYGWKDKQDIEITHNVDITVKLENARKRLAATRMPEAIEAEITDVMPMQGIEQKD